MQSDQPATHDGTGVNVLVTDYYCASNRGDAAILEGVRRGLTGVLPGIDLTVMTQHPRAAELVHGIDAVDQSLAGFRWRPSKRNLARAYLSLTSPLQARGLAPPGFERVGERANLQPYLEADLVVSTGGLHLTDYYFPTKVALLWEHHYLARLGTPVVLYAQSLGPFERSPYRALAARSLDAVDLILARDEQSRRRVLDLGVSTPVFHTADAAFSMPTDGGRATPLDALESDDEHPDRDGRTVSISVRKWQHAEPGPDGRTYVEAIADLADWLVEERDVDVLFASTCTGLAGYHADDRLVAARVVDEMDHGDDGGVRILTGEYTPRQLVAVYDRVDLHVGMRMHSNVLAMLAETPVVAIQYQAKTRGLMEQFDLLEYLVDVEKLTAASLRETVAAAMAERASIEDAVRSALPAIRERSLQSAALVSEHVDVPGASRSVDVRQRPSIGDRP